MLQIKTGIELDGWIVENVSSFGDPMLVAAHRADHPDTLATLKVSEVKGFAEGRQRREIRAVQSLDHPAIPRLLASGRTETDILYTAFRPFSGDSLSDRLVAGPIDWKQAVSWLYEIAHALQHLHHSGWVHRNLTPQNIYIGAHPEDVWLLGFECSQLVEEPMALDHTFHGSMAYLAPEVLADPGYHAPRADLYAFGLIAYEILCGEPAFPAAAWAEQADGARVLLEWKTRATELDPGEDLPKWLRDLVRKCTHSKSEMRLPDMDTVVSWLEASRGSWEVQSAPKRATPISVPREELPPLNVQPTFVDAAQLAEAIARQTATLQVQQQSPHRALLLMTAGVTGCAAGLAISALVVLFVELSRLG